MTKTLSVDDETHKKAVDKQKYIKNKYKVHINLNEVMAAAIRKGINNIEEEFGLKEVK